MTYFNAHDIATQLKQHGHKNVEVVQQGVKLSCCIGTHEDNSPSAFVVLNKGPEKFYKCFSCGIRLPITVFMNMMELEGDAISEVTEKIPRIQTKAKDLKDRRVPEDTDTLKEGIEIFSESHDYSLFDKVRKYIASRVCEGFFIPDNMHIRFNQDRLSLLLKGVENGITERFSKKTGRRFKNYGNSCLFHHYKEEVYDIVVVEGFFDYLTVLNAGYNAVALMTASMTPAKFRQLEKLVKNKVYLMLDNDSAGYSGTQKIKEELITRAIPFTVVEYTGKDPCELGIAGIRETLDTHNCRRIPEHPK